MITITYDEFSQKAVLSIDNPNQVVWTEITSLYRENSNKFEYIDYHSFAIPWWVFLYLRDDFVFIIANNGLTINDISYDAQVRRLLTIAQERVKEYLSPKIQINSNEIDRKLQSIGFIRQLKPYQIRNVTTLVKFPSAATFSVPGSGKTTEALAYFFIRKMENTKLVVVAPKNAFASWEDEMKLCIPNNAPQIVRLTGGEKKIEELLSTKPPISLISYQQLFRVEEILAKYLIENECFMFLDESHRMKKGFTGVYGSSILGLAHLPFCKLLLSGTPMPNDIEDLIPQFAFLYPEIPVVRETVCDEIKKIYVRTTKSELGLKEPIRIIKSVEMKPAQYRLYENLCSEARRQMEGLNINDQMIMRAFGKNIMRLLQVASEPSLLNETEIKDTRLLKDAIEEGSGAKIELAIKLARDLVTNGNKVLIWTQFVHNVEDIANKLLDVGAVYIHGGIETDEDESNLESREAKIRKFHDDPNCMVMVANPAACSEGISLHKICHNAIYIDRNYNAAHYLQSEDRIHRIGLDPKTNTNIVVLQCRNSIDESVQRRLEYKVNRMREVFNDPDLNIEPIQTLDEDSGISREDINDIFTVLLGGKS